MGNIFPVCLNGSWLVRIAANHAAPADCFPAGQLSITIRFSVESLVKEQSRHHRIKTASQSNLYLHVPAHVPYQIHSPAKVGQTL